LDEEITIPYLEESCTRTERGDRLGFDCRCNACTDEPSFHNAITAFCIKYGKDQDKIFTVVDDDTEAINDDNDAQC
jgi:hypothetical protein